MASAWLSTAGPMTVAGKMALYHHGRRGRPARLRGIRSDRHILEPWCVCMSWFETLGGPWIQGWSTLERPLPTATSYPRNLQVRDGGVA